MANSTWEVTNQLTNQVKNTPTGGTVEGTYIYFVTGEGNADAIFVPANIYPNKKKVHALLRTAADLVDEIGALTDQSIV